MQHTHASQRNKACTTTSVNRRLTCPAIHRGCDVSAKSKPLTAYQRTFLVDKQRSVPATCPTYIGDYYNTTDKSPCYRDTLVLKSEASDTSCSLDDCAADTVFVLAKTSARSPGHLIIFIIQSNSYMIKVSKSRGF